jgi:hypothetical protein
MKLHVYYDSFIKDEKDVPKVRDVVTSLISSVKYYRGVA